MLKVIKGFLSILLILVFNTLYAQDTYKYISREEYIKMYKPLVMEKMRQFKIPASIAMAQAMIESGNGNSELARYSNNHFGIKCHEWTGETFNWDDDKKQECFRKYSSVEESFYDHSLFLTSRPRYSSLFELDITDYKGWAFGLQKAGYATNPQYPQLLIKMIEENHLYEIDEEVLHGAVVAQAFESTTEVPENEPVVYTEVGPGPSHRSLLLLNRRLFVFSRADDTYFKIANDFNIPMTRLCHFNDVEPGSELTQGKPVFIEAKRRRSKTDVHYAQTGETMHDIAQNHGIRLKNLYRMNNMIQGEEPRAGQKLRLR
ncbi:MAG: glucosaminidase domain-containing protein [Bacteroidales bacterium]